jgi:hypothetical protein
LIPQWICPIQDVSCGVSKAECVLDEANEDIRLGDLAAAEGAMMLDEMEASGYLPTVIISVQ